MNQELFLKYAFPCAKTLVNRGTMTQEDYENVEAHVLRDEPLRKPISELFAVAFAHIQFLEHQGSKDPVHDYFWHKHDMVVEEQAKTRDDIHPRLCCVSKGTLIDENTVDLGEEKRKVKKDLCPNAKQGDKVAVHYDYIIEVLK